MIFFSPLFFCQNLFVYFLASIPICLYARSVFGAVEPEFVICIWYLHMVFLPFHYFPIYGLLFSLVLVSVV